jgi:hypothetical protein
MARKKIPYGKTQHCQTEEKPVSTSVDKELEHRPTSDQLSMIAVYRRVQYVIQNSVASDVYRALGREAVDNTNVRTCKGHYTLLYCS